MINVEMPKKQQQRSPPVKKRLMKPGKQVKTFAQISQRQQAAAEKRFASLSARITVAKSFINRVARNRQRKYEVEAMFLRQASENLMMRANGAKQKHS